MFNEDFFDNDSRDINELIELFYKIKNGEAKCNFSEEEFEYLLDYFESLGDKENSSYCSEIASLFFPNSISLNLRKIDWLVDQKKFGQALRILDEVDLIDTENIDALLMRANIYADMGKYQESTLLLEERVEKFEGIERNDILLELSEIYDEMEEFEMVYVTLKRILETEPESEEALLRICFWADMACLQEDSIELHKNILEDHPFNALAWYNLAVAYQGLKLYEKAIESYEYCLAIDEKYEYAYRNLGDAYMRLKNYDKAIEVLQKHIELSKPEDVILEAIGYCFEKQKQYSQARNYYRKASQLNPQDDSIFYKIGETYSKELQWEKAIKAYSVALHINKDNPSYCMALGNCLMEMNAEKEALVCYINAVRLKPSAKTTWIALIKALYKAQYFEEALTQMAIAEEHCGIKGELLFMKVALLLATGKTKECRNQLEIAMEQFPKKLSTLSALQKDLVQHPVIAEIVAKYKKKGK